MRLATAEVQVSKVFLVTLATMETREPRDLEVGALQTLHIWDRLLRDLIQRD